jgi:hypothetical protein
MRDGLPEGTVVRQQRGWCMGRNSVVVGRAPYSFKTCWDHCAEEYNDTVAIDGPPENCFCQDRCDEMMCDGQSIITRNDVEPGPCTDDHLDGPPNVICKASPQLYPPHTLPTSVI